MASLTGSESVLLAQPHADTDRCTISDLLGVGVPSVLCAAPVGNHAADQASIMAALAAGPVVQLRPGTYKCHDVIVPSGRRLIIPPGTTVSFPDNYATGSNPYRIFTAATPGTDIIFEGGGTIDGNRRGGNHGGSENVLGIDMSDALRVTVRDLRFYNFRSEGALFGHVSTVPEKVQVIGCRFEDCGVKESGDSGNPRQGVAFTAGKDLLVAYNQFDTVGGYAVDLEGNGVGDTFDNVVIGPNTYRGCPQGPVNVTSPGSVTNIQILDRSAAGSLGVAAAFVKPSALQNIQERFRITGDLALAPGDTAAHDLPSLGDLVLQGVRPGDWVRVGMNGTWDTAGTFRNLDVASIVSAAPVTYWGSRTGTIGVGVPSWRGNSGLLTNFSGSVMRRVAAGDIAVDGSLTLRFRYSLNSATTTTLYAGTLPLHAWAENCGATP